MFIFYISFSFSAYIIIDVQDKPGVLTNITKVFSQYKVSIKRVLQNPHKLKRNSSIVIITHRSKDDHIQKTFIIF